MCCSFFALALRLNLSNWLNIHGLIYASASAKIKQKKAIKQTTATSKYAHNTADWIVQCVVFLAYFISLHTRTYLLLKARSTFQIHVSNRVISATSQRIKHTEREREFFFEKNKIETNRKRCKAMRKNR